MIYKINLIIPLMFLSTTVVQASGLNSTPPEIKGRIFEYLEGKEAGNRNLVSKDMKEGEDYLKKMMQCPKLTSSDILTNTNLANANSRNSSNITTSKIKVNGYNWTIVGVDVIIYGTFDGLLNTHKRIPINAKTDEEYIYTNNLNPNECLYIEANEENEYVALRIKY
ncbi:MAG: hypothetical protein IBJ00_04165 [Alphaproteobacteria bacterium]|nr:hypothetical protein [Alphaproteobacteria bacterium]